MARAEVASASVNTDSIKGLAQSIAKPAYRRLLTAEPALRRAVPALIIAFLLTVCVGAVVAYEMAQQLLRAGEQVDCLVLLDTANPDSLKWRMRDRAQQHWRNLVNEGPGYLKERLTDNLGRRRKARDRKAKASAALSLEHNAFAYRVELVTEMSNQAELRYRPQPLDADVVLVKCDFRTPPTHGIGYPQHESNGWRGLLSEGRLLIRHVHCSHLDMVSAPQAAQTAQQMAAGLASVRAGAAADQG